MELDSFDTLKPLLTGWENIEAKSYNQANYNQLASLGSLVASTSLQPIALKMTLDSGFTELAETGVPLQEQRIYGACTSRRSSQLYQLPLMIYLGVPQQKYQHTSTNSYRH